MDYDKLTIEDISKGYIFDKERNKYVCNYCGEVFSEGRVYSIEDEMFTAKGAILKHIKVDHGGSFNMLINSDSKYNSLTETQKDLLKCFKSSLSDKEIGRELDISPSTVRHQKFTFREKAKQAKVYLAVYEQVFGNIEDDDSSIISVHNNANFVDERYIITEKEKKSILNTYFESLDPLILKEFPRKAKKKVAILTRIAEEFERGKKYSEEDVSIILGKAFEDHVTLRRYLIDYGFLDRTQNGNEYWLK